MPISNYPLGINDGVLLQEYPQYTVEDGFLHWVDTAKGAAGNPGTFFNPVKTMNQAVALSQGNRRDTIYLKAVYTDSLAAGTEVLLDKADTHIIGLGRGTSRATLDFTNAAGTISVTAANCSMHNMICSSSVADVLSAFTITAADFVCTDFVFEDAATDQNFLSVFDTGATDNQADGATFSRCYLQSPDALFQAFVNVDEDIDLLTVEDSYLNLAVNGVLSSVVEVAAGKDTTLLQLHRNYMTRLVAASAVQIITWADTTTTNTGLISDNECRTLDVAGELVATAGSNVHFTGNLTTSAVDKSGYALPTADS